MSRHVVLAGASGFIGQAIAEAYRADGARVSLIGRSGPDARWGDHARLVELLEGADLLVNLAGKSVDCRYTAANRAEILRSRVETTRELREAVAACAAPPPLWLNASTATIYRHAEDRPQTESDGELGRGFSVGVGRAWEAAFFEGDLPGTRRASLRIAIALGDGSALEPLIALTRLGLGGRQSDGWWPTTRSRRAAGTDHRQGRGGGRQRFSWIHLDDVVGVVRFVEEHPELEGPINVVSPHPSDNRTLMRTLRRVLGVPIGLPAQRWMLELGTWVLRTETELVLKSRWVLPEKLVAAGYEFRHPHLDEALKQIVTERRRRGR
ncbi:epimerase [Frigoribacterium salinisoli]